MLRSSHGSVIVIVAIMIPVLLGVGALAVDGARLYAAQRQLQAALDLAMLSAGSELPASADELRDAALPYLAANLPPGGWGGDYLNAAAAGGQEACRVSAAGIGTVTLQDEALRVETTQVNGDTVYVGDVCYVIAPVFAGILGYARLDIAARSSVLIPSGAGREVAIAFDWTEGLQGDFPGMTGSNAQRYRVLMNDFVMAVTEHFPSSTAAARSADRVSLIPFAASVNFDAYKPDYMDFSQDGLGVPTFPSTALYGGRNSHLWHTYGLPLTQPHPVLSKVPAYSSYWRSFGVRWSWMADNPLAPGMDASMPYLGVFDYRPGGSAPYYSYVPLPRMSFTSVMGQERNLQFGYDTDNGFFWPLLIDPTGFYTGYAWRFAGIVPPGSRTDRGWLDSGIDGFLLPFDAYPGAAASSEKMTLYAQRDTKSNAMLPALNDTTYMSYPGPYAQYYPQPHKRVVKGYKRNTATGDQHLFTAEVGVGANGDRSCQPDVLGFPVAPPAPVNGGDCRVTLAAGVSCPDYGCVADMWVVEASPPTDATGTNNYDGDGTGLPSNDPTYLNRKARTRSIVPFGNGIYATEYQGGCLHKWTRFVVTPEHAKGLEPTPCVFGGLETEPQLAFGKPRPLVGLSWAWLALSPRWQGRFGYWDDVFNVDRVSDQRPYLDATGEPNRKFAILVVGNDGMMPEDDPSFAAMCASMKTIGTDPSGQAYGITIITVGFGIDMIANPAMVNLLSSCASRDESNQPWYYPVNSTNDLQAVVEGIKNAVGSSAASVRLID